MQIHLKLKNSLVIKIIIKIMIIIAMMMMIIRAYETYVADHGAGDDGRGDWESSFHCFEFFLQFFILYFLFHLR